MILSYREITPELARQTRLVMTDVDGTLTSADDSYSPGIFRAVRRLEERGIPVGLVSGRTLPELDALADRLHVSGPIIAENGGVARLAPGGRLIEFGYRRQPALEAMAKLKTRFPGAIREREDNAERLVDVVIFIDGIDTDEARRVLGDVQLVDSGYICHLMAPGISKGTALLRLLSESPEAGPAPSEVMVFGDSPTDISLFEAFPHSVLIPNPRLPAGYRDQVVSAARYVSDLPFGEGFAQVAFHLADAYDEGT